MYSINNFYDILYQNLFKPANFDVRYFFPFGTTGAENIMRCDAEDGQRLEAFVQHIFLAHDQEPLLDKSLDYSLSQSFYQKNFCKLLGNSEHSEIKKEICKRMDMIDLYYFYHGFAALYWFSDWKYLANTNYKFIRPFISLNHLTVNDRSYRLLLVSKLIDKNLINKGFVSLHAPDSEYTWQSELNNRYTRLPKNQINFIHQQLEKINFKSLIADTNRPNGDLSAAASGVEFKFYQKSFLHVVSETVFYHKKLHLTEKIFKPIACRRPFILVAAPGNLQYLKSYGFKTFDKWIDESYDLEQDDNLRLEKIVCEIEKISSLSRNDLQKLYEEMHETLQFNFDHFYGEFKNLIVKELLTNFKSAVNVYNNGLINPNLRVYLDNIDFDSVLTLLSQ